MKRKLVMRFILGLMVCLLSRGSVLRADQWNKKTILTVKDTIQVPGAVLTPGKYVFRLMESNADRHIVQVFNEDETHLLTTILAIPNERLRPTGESEFGFWEVPQGSTPALRSWFYPGDNFGQEFSYPKTEATQLSQITHQEVPSVSEEEQARLNQETKAPPTTASAAPAAPAETPQTQQAQVNPQPETPAQSTPPAVNRGAQESREYPKAPSTVQVNPAPATQPVPQSQAASNTLPGTASPLPLIELFGFLSLGAGYAFGKLRRRR
jgi:hypothetical protein